MKAPKRAARSGARSRARTAPKSAVARKRVGFIGAGRVGCAVAWHCQRLGYPVSGIVDVNTAQARAAYRLLKQPYRRLTPHAVAAASDVLFLTVPDSQIVPVFGSVREALGTVSARGQSPPIVAHCSGAFGAGVLAGARAQGLGTLALHPVRAFSDRAQSVGDLPGSFFALDGSVSGLRFGRELVKQLGGTCLVVRTSDRALYHAMCVFASNFVNTLFGAAEEIAAELGISRRRVGLMLEPLVRSVLTNIVRQGAMPSLTGPVERGDDVTVASHLRALKKRVPALSLMYRVLSGRLVAMARRKGLDRAAVRKLEKVLAEK